MEVRKYLYLVPLQKVLAMHSATTIHPFLPKALAIWPIFDYWFFFSPVFEGVIVESVFPATYNYNFIKNASILK